MYPTGLPIWCQRLRFLRENRELSQEEVATAIHTSQSYYAQYELGKRSLPFERIVDLARFYDVSLDYLAGFTNIPSSIHET